MPPLPILLVAVLVQGLPTPSDPYFVGEAASSVAPDTVLGSVGSGLACVPVGKLRWADIAKPTPTVWIDAGQRVLIEARLAPKTDPGAPRGRYRVAVTIKALKLDLCLAWMGIGKKPRGKGVATIGVAVRDTVANTDLPVRDIDIDLNLKGRDPRKDETVVTEAIGDAMRKFVATLSAG